jgi:glutamyl-tRNA synthetase
VTSISDFQKMGFVAPALANYMTLLGWSAPDAEEQFTLADAAKNFSFRAGQQSWGQVRLG